MGGPPPPQVGTIRTIGGEPAGLRKFAQFGNHRQPVGQGETSDPLAKRKREAIGEGNQRILTKPLPTGSPPSVMTTGILSLACMAARIGASPPTTKMSTGRRAKSLAKAGKR